MSDQTKQLKNPAADLSAKLLRMSDHAQLNHYAAEILSTEFPSNIELIIPHLQSAWVNLQTLQESFADISDNQDKNLNIQKEYLTDKLPKLAEEFKILAEEISKIQFEAGELASNSTIRKVESHISELANLIYKIRLYLLSLQGWRPWYKRRWVQILIAIVILSMLCIYGQKKYKRHQLGYKIIKSSQQWGSLAVDRTVEGNRLKVGGVSCSSGLGTHAKSEIVIEIQPSKTRLKGICGLDDETNARKGSIECEIKQESETLFKSPMLLGTNRSIAFDVPVNSKIPVKLIITDAGNGIQNDHADWCNLTAK